MSVRKGLAVFFSISILVSLVISFATSDPPFLSSSWPGALTHCVSVSSPEQRTSTSLSGSGLSSRGSTTSAPPSPPSRAAGALFRSTASTRAVSLSGKV